MDIAAIVVVVVVGCTARNLAGSGRWMHGNAVTGELARRGSGVFARWWRRRMVRNLPGFGPWQDNSAGSSCLEIVDFQGRMARAP